LPSPFGSAKKLQLFLSNNRSHAPNLSNLFKRGKNLGFLQKNKPFPFIFAIFENTENWNFFVDVNDALGLRWLGQT
jgi:hypothetical protein